jgi:hypothetical protein
MARAFGAKIGESYRRFPRIGALDTRSARLDGVELGVLNVHVFFLAAV